MNRQEKFDFMATLLAERLEDLPLSEEAAADPAFRDRNGQNTRSLISDYGFLANAYYLLNNDVNAFRDYLMRVASLAERLFKRHSAGDSISASYLSLLNYKHILASLAAGEWEQARALAELVGNWGEKDKEMVHPFDYFFGLTLKHVVLEDKEKSLQFLQDFREVCEMEDMQDFLGYGDVFQAILDQNLKAAQDGLQRIATGHEKQGKGQGVFANSVDDQLLCVWGIGMANLCRNRGLPVDGIPPLIPEDLLI